MTARHEALTRPAVEHGPCSVRHLFYRAVVEEVAGITKNGPGYMKVQRALLELRRSGAIAYEHIVDNTRWMRMPEVYGSVEEALAVTAALYRRDLWRESQYRVEVWCESDSIASTVLEVTRRWAVPLMVSRGYSSETFAYAAADAWRDGGVPVVLYVGDHDPAGLEIEDTLRRRLSEFYGSDDVVWQRVGVTWAQVEELDLPGTTPKKPYGYPRAVEAEALPPRLLTDLLDRAIGEFADPEQIALLEVAEQEERDWLERLARREFVG